ncbi:hypothetical protein ACJ72_01218 [Emergomyces africanus]|uniref:Uncharacterized protein n=1 Tax=Emergomyces africanus TaxID=1955775 RepID=A0A1B7P5V4_9EURO|nr:hypothetical protein ACJ72_01218 [Emergomyces africanus]
MPKKVSLEDRDRMADEADFHPDKHPRDARPVLKAIEDRTKGHSWKRFTAHWAREKGEKLPHSVTNSGTNFIFQKLHKHVKLNLEHDERDYVTLKHFKNLLQQLWHNNWHAFPYPLYRVYLLALLKMSMFSSAQVGEYVESTARQHSGRGLYVPEGLTFLVIHNHKDQSEIIIQPTRDSKGMSRKKHKHPRHPMQEDIESLPLYLNPVLEPLAICLARGLFLHFKTADEIFALKPPAEEKYELALDPSTVDLYKQNPGELVDDKKNMAEKVTLHHSKAGRGTPFFEKMSPEGPTREILSASWFGGELGKLSRRSGYDKLISVHDMRAEALVRTNETGHSIEELMQFAGHGGNPQIYFESYMSSTSTVSGVSNILRLGQRRDLAEPLCGLTLRRHPRLWQTLPAKLRQDLESSEECAKLNDQINELTIRMQTAGSDDLQELWEQ